MNGSRIIMLAALALVQSISAARGQSSSLFGAPGERTWLTLEDSWFYQKIEPPRQVQMNDLVTVVVDEKAQVISEGEVDRRLQSSIDARLQNWVKLDGTSLLPAPFTHGAPRGRGQLNSQYRANSEIETREGLKFRFTARVVDIRPNGTLVLEAHKTINNNDETWRYSLSGIVRREDVLPNNTVLSEKIAELSLTKSEAGQVRDGIGADGF